MRISEEVFHNCSIPDCEYMAHAGSAKCSCHSREFNPPMPFEKYMQLRGKELTEYRKKLLALEKENSK